MIKKFKPPKVITESNLMSGKYVVHVPPKFTKLAKYELESTAGFFYETIDIILNLKKGQEVVYKHQFNDFELILQGLHGKPFKPLMTGKYKLLCQVKFGPGGAKEIFVTNAKYLSMDYSLGKYAENIEHEMIWPKINPLPHLDLSKFSKEMAGELKVPAQFIFASPNLATSKITQIVPPMFVAPMFDEFAGKLEALAAPTKQAVDALKLMHDMMNKILKPLSRKVVAHVVYRGEHEDYYRKIEADTMSGISDALNDGMSHCLISVQLEMEIPSPDGYIGLDDAAKRKLDPIPKEEFNVE